MANLTEKIYQINHLRLRTSEPKLCASWYFSLLERTSLNVMRFDKILPKMVNPIGSCATIKMVGSNARVFFGIKYHLSWSIQMRISSNAIRTRSPSSHIAEMVMSEPSNWNTNVIISTGSISCCWRLNENRKLKQRDKMNCPWMNYHFHFDQ